MKTAQFVLDNAEKSPEKVREILIKLHQKGESVSDILEFAEELEKRKIKIPIPEKKIFDVCGTGGSGKKRMNLSTALAVKLSQNFTIAKHGNRASSGKVGSFDLIESAGYEMGDTPEKVKRQIVEKNLSFVFAPAFHPALKPLAPIRKEIPNATIFNYLGPILNPVEKLTAQMTGVSDPLVAEKLAEVAIYLGKNILFVHDSEFDLDDVSVGGKTDFWISGFDKKIHTGHFFPEDYGISRVQNFEEISGGNVEDNLKIFKSLLEGNAPKAHLDFLEINRKVAAEFFRSF